VTEPDAMPHFLHVLGLELWHDADGHTRARAQVTPTMFVPGTERPRLGLLATLSDIVAGIPVDGPINPTIDLRVTLVGPPPGQGAIDLVCRPVKAGRRLFLGEVLLHADGDERPFARAFATFLNRSITIPDQMDFRNIGPQSATFDSFDEMLDLQSIGTPDAPAFALDNHGGIANSSGVITGGAQALMAEIAAEHRVTTDREWAGVELDLRYVNGVRTGPLVARPERQAAFGNDLWVRVPLTEGERIIALATMRFVPVDTL
jgi:acyl-coenzyme A thioesterase PaaI-like protein